MKTESVGAKQVELENRLSVLNNELTELQALYNSIDAALDRMVGPVPQEGESEQGAREPQSYIERFDEALGRLQAVRKQLAECKSRLEDAI